MHRQDLTKLTPVAEAHFTDLYGNAIKRFHEKYKDAGPEFFVNFNPKAGDERDKTIVGQQMDNAQKIINRDDFDGEPTAKKDRHHTLFKKPNHGDPVGTYGYPAEYVANHWYDVDYGKDMKHLRVLKLTAPPDRILWLAEMNQADFLKAMKKLNLEFNVHGDGRYCTRLKNDAIMIYEAIFDSECGDVHLRVNSYAKVLFKLIQREYTFEVNKGEADGDKEESKTSDQDYDPEKGDFEYQGYLKVASHKILSQQQQNERARHGGWDVILDTATTPLEATIHPNEPEQAIFLTKRSYDVVEVFNLPDLPEHAEGVVLGTGGVSRAVKKIGGMVAAAIGDRIADEATSSTGIALVKNLDQLRNWLATEEIESFPTEWHDPTMAVGKDRVDAWITAKGRLIVVAPERGHSGDVENTDALTSPDDLDIRIRPGEGEGWIKDNLRRFHSSMEKGHHRVKMDFNTMTFKIGIVGEWPKPIYVSSQSNEKAEDLVKQVKSALAQKTSWSAAKAMSAGNLSAKPPFRRITIEILNEFTRAQKRPIKPKLDPAIRASAAIQPSTKPEATDDMTGRPAP